MALQIIGAGFGRTGTNSMQQALEILGLGPCYHMYEVLPHKDLYDKWQQILYGTHPPNWDQLFNGYAATVDWPAAHFWRELADHFPKAWILLTWRDAEGWYASMEKTILAEMRNPARKTGMPRCLAEVAFAGQVADKAHVISVYEAHNAAVRAAFGPERLLTYRLGSGWGPLCAFLGVAVPDVPFPKGNDSAAFFEKGNAMCVQREGGDAPPR